MIFSIDTTTMFSLWMMYSLLISFLFLSFNKIYSLCNFIWDISNWMVVTNRLHVVIQRNDWFLIEKRKFYRSIISSRHTNEVNKYLETASICKYCNFWLGMRLSLSPSSTTTTDWRSQSLGSIKFSFLFTETRCPIRFTIFHQRNSSLIFRSYDNLCVCMSSHMRWMLCRKKVVGVWWCRDITSSSSVEMNFLNEWKM
jgi:hypothetical protein